MKFKKLTPVGFAARADPLTDSWRPIFAGAELVIGILLRPGH